jgi:hypothetical protein
MDFQPKECWHGRADASSEAPPQFLTAVGRSLDSFLQIIVVGQPLRWRRKGGS